MYEFTLWCFRDFGFDSLVLLGGSAGMLGIGWVQSLGIGDVLN